MESNPPADLPKMKDQRPGRPLRACFFGYSWRADRELDGYMAANVEAIRSLGVDVDVYLGNYFTARRGTQGLHPEISSSRLARYLRQQGYDFALAFNNALLIPRVIDALGCRPVSVIVDSEQHLFDHYGRGGYSAFELDIVIAPVYTALQRVIERRYPQAMNRFHFLPPATDVRARSSVKDTNPRHVISWIASLVGDVHLDELIAHVARAREGSGIVPRCLEQIARTGHLDHLRVAPKVIELATQLGWEMDFLEIHLQNIVTNDQRVAAVERLSDRGLRLYGNDRWATILAEHPAVARSLSRDAISSHAEQMAVYNSSKLSINLPQAQAGTGIQYRVIDVMASRALLLTKHVEDSNLFHIFGRDCPVPRFASHDELVRLVDHYLANETERLDLVARCNDLVSKGFSFAERATDYLRLSNPDAASMLTTIAAPSAAAEVEPGSLSFVDRARFPTWMN